MYGLVPVISPMLLSRLFEKVFGAVTLPAKSGKEENSIEKDTNPSNGTPASSRAESEIATLVLSLEIVGDARVARKEPNPHISKKAAKRAMIALQCSSTTTMNCNKDGFGISRKVEHNISSCGWPEYHYSDRTVICENATCRARLK